MTHTATAAGKRALEKEFATLERRLAARFPRSMEQHKQSRNWMPGGVSRGIHQVDPFPLCVERAHDGQIVTIDGEALTNFSGDYSSGLYGHSNPIITAAAHEAIDEGFSFGATSSYEGRLAELFCARFPSIEKLRFCNSGTEANLFAMLLARAASERNKVVVFDGGYHGGITSFRPGVNTLKTPLSFLIATYNDTEGARKLIEDNADEIACVAIEPMLGGGMALPASQDFLDMLRSVTQAHDIILIFDEVVTSRLSTGGLQKVTGVTPDMTAFGKYLGGGFAFGAFGGRADIMDRLDYVGAGRYFHTGTHNNNPVTMRVAYTALTEVATEDAIDRVNRRGDALRAALNDLAKRHDVDACATGLGSLCDVHFCRGPIATINDLSNEKKPLQRLFYLAMTLHGFFVSRRGSIALSLDITDRHIDAFTDAVDQFFTEYSSFFAMNEQ